MRRSLLSVDEFDRRHRTGIGGLGQLGVGPLTVRVEHRDALGVEVKCAGRLEYTLGRARAQVGIDNRAHPGVLAHRSRNRTSRLCKLREDNVLLYRRSEVSTSMPENSSL